MKQLGPYRQVGAALTAGLLATSALAFAPVPANAPNEEKIAFTTVSREGKSIASVAIALMNPDGSQRTTLTKGDAMEMDPALSPDGKRIVFVTIGREDQKSELWVMKADGSDRKQLADNKGKGIAFSPCWSPNGRKIAYSRMVIDGGDPPAGGDLMVIDADGKNVMLLANGIMPAWSPDGKKILYTVIQKAGDFEPRLRVMDSDGKNARELLKGRAMMGAWSPDGKRIVYTGSEEGQRANPHVFVCNADGTEPKQLTKENGMGELGARWSADGKRVYFSRLSLKGPPEKASIFSMDANGTNQKELSKDGAMDLLGGAPLLMLSPREARKP
jgi:Tol biopolymer transport system component